VLLPKPYPDELVGSVFMRASRWTGLTFQRLLAHLAGERANSHSMLLPSYPGIASACGLTPEALVRHHSLFPYAVSFLPPDIREARLVLFASAPHQRAGGSLAQKIVRNSRELKFCPECVIEDVQAFGESYWHCLHQLDGYLHCAKHACNLQVAPLALRTRQQVFPNEVRSIARSILLTANPLTVARLSVRVRDAFYWRLKLPRDLHALYLRSARMLGYTLSSRRALAGALACDVTRYFGAELLEALGCPEAQNGVSWPGRMLRRDGDQFSPIKHVLLGQFFRDAPRRDPDTT